MSVDGFPGPLDKVAPEFSRAVRNWARTAASPAAVPYRARGSFAKHRRQIASRSDGTLGLILLGGSGIRVVAHSMLASHASANGGLPTNISYNVAPIAYTSD